MKCGEIGCEIKATTRGYCGKHYHKRVRSGELAILRPMLGGTAMEKLLRHIQQEPDGCWKWTGCVGGHGYKNGLGYGVIWHDGKLRRANRLSYELHKGTIPDGMHVCHTCDNRLCVNPDHLFLGSPRDNMQDCVNKGRAARGERNGLSKLTEKQVIEIRRRYTQGGVSQKSLAIEFGTDQSNISYIVSGKKWKHIA